MKIKQSQLPQELDPVKEEKKQEQTSSSSMNPIGATGQPNPPPQNVDQIAQQPQPGINVGQQNNQDQPLHKMHSWKMLENNVNQPAPQEEQKVAAPFQQPPVNQIPPGATPGTEEYVELDPQLEVEQISVQKRNIIEKSLKDQSNLEMIAKTVNVSPGAVAFIDSKLAEKNKFTPEKVERLKGLMFKLDPPQIANIFECPVEEI